MDKNKLATAVIGGVGLCYTAAIAADPDMKADCEEYVENAAEAIGNIPITVMEEFALISQDGDYIVTQDGDRILGRSKVSYDMDLKSHPEIAIISTVKSS